MMTVLSLGTTSASSSLIKFFLSGLRGRNIFLSFVINEDEGLVSRVSIDDILVRVLAEFFSVDNFFSLSLFPDLSFLLFQPSHVKSELKFSEFFGSSLSDLEIVEDGVGFQAYHTLQLDFHGIISSFFDLVVEDLISHILLLGIFLHFLTLFITFFKDRFLASHIDNKFISLKLFEFISILILVKKLFKFILDFTKLDSKISFDSFSLFFLSSIFLFFKLSDVMRDIFIELVLLFIKFLIDIIINFFFIFDLRSIKFIDHP
mmetsp:Transcript_8770/g.7743  ORF Transcript_8770/g.7743 Transcript_8770/m.7743 type:complete len:261 (+) Transcript_8770:2004-2786(+)